MSLPPLTAPIPSGWNVLPCRAGLTPAETPRLCTAHQKSNFLSITVAALFAAAVYGFVGVAGAHAATFPLYVSTDDTNMYKVDSGGNPTTFIHDLNLFGLAFDPAGNLFASNYSFDKIEMITPGGSSNFFASTLLQGDTRRQGSAGLAFDSAGNLYVANYLTSTIEKFTPGGLGGVFATALLAA